MCCAIVATQFNMNVDEAILSLVLAFIFSFIGVQSAGVTDINPISTVAKAFQLIFNGITKATGLPIKSAQTLNLAGGVILGGAAGQGADMTGDLKTGYLLRAKPCNQFVAQLCSAVVAVFLSTGHFILFPKASPCIMYVSSSLGSFLTNPFQVLRSKMVPVPMVHPQLLPGQLSRLLSLVPTCVSNRFSKIAHCLTIPEHSYLQVFWIYCYRSCHCQRSHHHYQTSFPRSITAGSPTGMPLVSPSSFLRLSIPLPWLSVRCTATFGRRGIRPAMTCTCLQCLLACWLVRVWVVSSRLCWQLLVLMAAVSLLLNMNSTGN